MLTPPVHGPHQFIGASCFCRLMPTTMFPCSSSLPLSPSRFLHLLLLLLLLLFTDPSFTVELQEPVLASPSTQISSTPSNCSSCNNTVTKPAAEDSSGSIPSLSSASNVNNNLTLNKSSSPVLVKNSTSVDEVLHPMKPNTTPQAKAPQPPSINNMTVVSPGGDTLPASSQPPVSETEDGPLITTNPPSQNSTTAGATPLTTVPLTNAATVATGIPAPSTATKTSSAPSTSSSSSTLKTTPSSTSSSPATSSTSSSPPGTSTSSSSPPATTSSSSSSPPATSSTPPTTGAPTTTTTTTTSSTATLTTTAPPAPGTTVAPPHLSATTVATNTLQSTSLVTEASGFALAGAALTKHLVDTASLLAVLVFGLLFFLVTVAVFVTQAYESYRRKDYTQVDYLINGMYTDSGV